MAMLVLGGLYQRLALAGGNMEGVNWVVMKKTKAVADRIYKQRHHPLRGGLSIGLWGDRTRLFIRPLHPMSRIFFFTLDSSPGMFSYNVSIMEERFG